MYVKNFIINKNFWNFLFLYNNFIFYFFFLLHNSSKIIIKLKYGLYHYFFWLKVGCKNIKWKRAFTVYFLLDYIFSAVTAVSIYNYMMTTLKYNYLPIRKSIFTISKGPMVRKKQSREQFMFKQIFVNVKKIIHFFNKKNYKPSIIENKSIGFIKNNQLLFFGISFNNKSLSSLFLFLNFNINFFLYFIKNINLLNFFIETNLFFLKKINLFLNFNDINFFYI